MTADLTRPLSDKVEVVKAYWIECEEVRVITLTNYVVLHIRWTVVRVIGEAWLVLQTFTQTDTGLLLKEMKDYQALPRAVANGAL